MSVPDFNIGALTYTHVEHRKEWHFFLDCLLDRMAPMFSISDPSSLVKELGALTVIPAELLLDILEYLSIIDLMRFGRCNRYSSYFLNTIPPLRTALRVAPNTVKGIMAMQVSTYITAKQLCQKLYQRECDECGKLAQCIYLPTCLRACFLCVHPRNGYFSGPKTEDELSVEYMLSPEQIAARPSWRPLLGTFTNGMTKFKTVERHRMYDCPSDDLRNKLGWSLWYDKKTVREMDPDPSALTEGRVRRQLALREKDHHGQAITITHDPMHIDLQTRMAIVIAPWPNPTTSKIEEGVFCSTCVGTWRDTQLYTKEAFSEHLKDCRVQPDRIPIKDQQQPRTWLCEDDE